MLEHKDVRYRRINLIHGLHPFLVRRMLGFDGDTVPALVLDHRKLQETRTISRELELIPSEAVPAEEWAERALRPIKRDLLWWALCIAPTATSSFVPYPLPPAIQRLLARVKPPDERAARAALAAVPDVLDRVDTLIADGMIGDGEPNSADLHAAVLVRMLACFDDLRPSITGRPGEALADRLCPPERFPGRVPAVF